MARRLPLHGSLDDAGHARGFLRPRAGVGQDRDAGAPEFRFNNRRPDQGIDHAARALGCAVLVLVAEFRMPGYISSAMAVPLFKSLHYSDTDIATVTKLFGFWVGLGGTFLASYISHASA
jgi:hypothetical protein